jgi:two-component system sensor histidine kinase YesM
LKRKQREEKGKRRLTLKMRLALLLFVTAIPLTAMMLGILNMIRDYSVAYNGIIANLKVANEFNITFKEDMEYSMYRKIWPEPIARLWMFFYQKAYASYD